MKPNKPLRVSFEKVVTSEHQSSFWKHVIRKQFRTPYHYHPECEIIYIRQGVGRRWVGGSITHFGPGDLVFIAPNVPHMWEVAPECPLAEVFYIQFLPDFMGADFFNVPEMLSVGELIESAHGGVKFSDPVSKKVAALLNKSQNLNSSECLLNLLDILYRLSQDQDSLPLGNAIGRANLKQRQEERIGEAFRYINHHLNEQISQAEVAKRVNLSPAAFSRLFKNTTGRCFMEVVNELRIAQVCRLLADTDRTISEIAYSCGYETLSNFNSKFLKLMNMTPREYRRNLEEIRGQSA